MVRVWIPALLREITQGVSVLDLEGRTVRELIEQIDNIYPGFRERIIKDDKLIADISVVIDGAVSYRGLSQMVRDAEEIHFLPVLAGG